MGVKMFDRADPSQKQTEIFQDISGGVNTEIADEAMPDNQRRAIVNLDIDSGGYAKKRPGLHRIPWITTLIWSKLNSEYKNGNIDDLTSLLVTDVYMFYDGANYVVNYITNKGLVVLILTSDMMPVNTNASTGAILSDDVQVVQPVQFYKDIVYNVRISDYSTQFILISSVYRITPDYTITDDEKQVRYYSWCPIQDPLGPNQLTKGWVEACEQDDEPISQTFYGETNTTVVTSTTLSLVNSADLVNNFYIGNKSDWTDDSDFYYYTAGPNPNGILNGAVTLYFVCKDIRDESIVWEQDVISSVTKNPIPISDIYNMYIVVDATGKATSLYVAYRVDDSSYSPVAWDGSQIKFYGSGLWANDRGWNGKGIVKRNLCIEKFNIGSNSLTVADKYPIKGTTNPQAFSTKQNSFMVGWRTFSGIGYTYNATEKPKNSYIALGATLGTGKMIYGTMEPTKNNRSFYIEEGVICIPTYCAGGSSTSKNGQFYGILWDYSDQLNNSNDGSDKQITVGTGNNDFQNDIIPAVSSGFIKLVDGIQGAIFLGDRVYTGTDSYDNTATSSLGSSSFFNNQNPIIRYVKNYGLYANNVSGWNSGNPVGKSCAYVVDSCGLAATYGGGYIGESRYYASSVDGETHSSPLTVQCVAFLTDDLISPAFNDGLESAFIKSIYNPYNTINPSTTQYACLKSTSNSTSPNFTDQESYFSTIATTSTNSVTNIQWDSLDATGPNLGDLYKNYLGYWSSLGAASFDVVFEKTILEMSNISTPSKDYNGFKNVTFTWLSKFEQEVIAYTPNPIAFFKIANVLPNYAPVKTYKLSDFFNQDEIQSVYDNQFSLVDFSMNFYYNNNTKAKPVEFEVADYNVLNFIEDLLSVENWDQQLIEVSYLVFSNYCFNVKVTVKIPTNSESTTFKEIILVDFVPDNYDITTVQDGVIKMFFEMITGAKADNPSLFTQQQYTIPNINDFGYLWYNLSNFNVRVTGLTPNTDDPTIYPFLPPELVQYPTTQSSDNSPFMLSSIVPVNSIILKPGDNQRFQVFWAENVDSTYDRNLLWANWYIGSMDDYNAMITQDDYSTSNSLNWVQIKSAPNTFESSKVLQFQNNDQGTRVWYADLNIPVSSQITLIQFNLIASKDTGGSPNDKDPATYRSTSLQLDPASTTQTKIDTPSIFDQFVATNKLITYRSSLVSYGKTNKLFFSEISNPTYFPLKWVLEMPTNEAITCCTIFQNQLVVSTENQKFYVSGVSFDDQDNPFEIHSITQEAGAVNDQCEHSFQDRLFFHDSSGFKALKNLYSTTEKEFNYVTMDTDIKSLIPKDKTGMLIVTFEDKLYIHYPSNKSMIIYNAKLDNFTTYQSDIMNFKKIYVVNGMLYCISGAQGMGSDMFKIWYFDKDTYVDDWNPEEDGYETVLIPFENNIAHRVQKGVWYECYLKTKNLDLEYPYHWKKLNEITVTTATNQLTTIVNPEIEFDNNRINYTLDLYRDITGKLIYQIDNPDTLVIRTGTKIDNTWILGKTKLGDQETTQHQMNVGRPARTFALGLRHQYPLPVTFMNFNVRYGILKNRANTSRKIS